MIDGMSRPVRRSVALGLLLATVLGIGGLILSPLLTAWSDNERRISEERERLAKLRATLAHGQNSSPVDLVNRRQALIAAQVQGRTESQQLAALQDVLRTLAQKSAVRFQSLRAIPPFERNGTRFVSAQFSLTTKLKNAQQLIWDLESVRPIIFIEGLELAPTLQRDGQPAAEAEVHLSVRLAAPIAMEEIASSSRPREISR